MWQKADELVVLIYKITRAFPADEKYGLTSQLRRAALSVALNIVEGYARSNIGDLRRFLDISLGSLAEVEYLLELSLKLKYLDQDNYERLEEIRVYCGKLLWSYRRKIDK